jgi:hypothetical protein
VNDPLELSFHASLEESQQGPEGEHRFSGLAELENGGMFLSLMKIICELYVHL